MEFEQARNLWMAGVRHLGEATSEAEYETQFSMLVEQEVEKRILEWFQLNSLGISGTEESPWEETNLFIIMKRTF